MNCHTFLTRLAFLLLFSSLVPVSSWAVSASIDWNITYSRTHGGDESFVGSHTDTSGNTCVMIVRGYDDLVLLKYNSAGALTAIMPCEQTPMRVWPRTMTMDSGGNIYAASTDWSSSRNVSVAKWNPDGTLAWEKIYDSGDSEEPWDVTVDSGGNVFVAGELAVGLNPTDALILKYDGSGNFQWARSVDHGGSDIAYAVTADGSGNSFLGGLAVMPALGSSTSYMFGTKFNSAGTVLFSRTYTSGSGLGNERVSAGWYRASNSSLYVAWEDSGRVGAARIDPSNGNLLNTVVDLTADQKEASDIAVNATGEIFIAGNACCSGGGMFDLVVLGFDASFSGSLPGWPVTYDGGGMDGQGWGAKPEASVGIDALGNVYLSGWSDSFPSVCTRGSRDVFTGKYLGNGVSSWERRYDGKPETWAGDVALDPGSNPYCMANVENTSGLFKFDAASGALLWSTLFEDGIHCMLYGSDMAYYGGLMYLAMEGMNTGTFEFEFVVAKYDSLGNLVDTISYNPPVGDFIGPPLIVLDATGNIFLASSSYSLIGGEAPLIAAQLSSVGALVWSRTLTYADEDNPDAIALDDSGGFYVVEAFPEDGVSVNSYGVLKFDAFSGSLIWSRTYAGGTVAGNPTNMDAAGPMVYITGMDDSITETYGRILKIDSAGNMLWSKSYNAGGGELAAFFGIDVAASGSIYVTGAIGSLLSPAQLDYLTASYDSSGNLRWDDRYASGLGLDYGSAVAAGSSYVTGGDGNHVRAMKYVEAAGPTAALKASLAATPGIIQIGEWVEIVLSVTNTGTANATGVTPDLEFNTGGPLLEPISGPSPPSVATLASGGGSASFTWTYSASGSGPITLTGTASGTDAGSAGPVSAGDSTSLVAGVAILDGSLSVVPATISVGQNFDVRFSVTNTGGATAANVAPDLDVNPGSGGIILLTGPIPLGPLAIAAGSSTVFVWTYAAVGAGTVCFTTTASGTDTGMGGPVSASDSTCGSIQTPASLEVYVTAIPNSVKQGATILVTMTVTNTGQAAAVDVTPTPTAGPAGTGTVLEVLGPVPSSPVTVPGGGSLTFGWVYAALFAGTVDFTATAAGTDANSGSPVSGKDTSGVVTITSAPVLAATAWLVSAEVDKGGTFSMSLTVVNFGGSNADNVSPSLAISDPSIAQIASGPTPISATIMSAPLPLGGTVYVWQLDALQAGSVVLTASATGTDPGDGSRVGAVAGPVTGIVRGASLACAVSVTPGAVREGRSFSVALDVTDTGDAAATLVGPSLTLSNPALAQVVSGPSPASVAALAPAASQEFVWQLEAKGKGTLALSVSASGKDVDGTAIGTQTQKSVVIETRFADEIVVYPNPIAAGVLNILMKLEADASEVEVDVYNVAYRRIYTGNWRNVSQAVGEVQIEDAGEWSPGVYFLRARAVLAGGTEQEFPVVKVVVEP